MKRLLPLLLSLLLALTPVAHAETLTFSDMALPGWLVAVEMAEDGNGMTLKLTMTPTAATGGSVARWSIYGNGDHWGSLTPSGSLQFSGWVEGFDRNGTLMVFKDPETNYLKNLEEFLYEWGVVFDGGVVVDLSNSITSDGKSLVASYPSGTLASSIHKDISSLAAPPKTIVKNASPLAVSELYTAGRDADGVKTNTWTYSGNNAYRELSAVLTASPTATVVEDGEVTDREGGYNLMTVTREMNTENNDTYYGYVLAAGTRYFTSPDYLESNTYANENILYYALRVMGREKVPADIPFKEFANTKIEDMTSAEAIRASILLITVIPLLAAVCGAVVTTRRKYK